MNVGNNGCVVAALAKSSRVHTIAIEHEDPFVAPEEGVPEAAGVLAKGL